MNNKGFTLVEVLAVVAIIAILGIVAVPNILSILNTSNDANDRVLYGNIKTALITMYEEIYYAGNSFSSFNVDGSLEDNISINDNTLTVNVQTLVNNGFLSGVNNNEVYEGNKNLKIVYDSKGENLGGCVVSAVKKVDDNTNKVSYELIADVYNNSDFCPRTEDFEGE